MKKKISHFDDLLYNPSMLFSKHYTEQNRHHFEDARRFQAEIEAAKRQVYKSRQKYEK